ncbi:MAG: septum formation initiator family protein [Lysinibacillus sp.]
MTQRHQSNTNHPSYTKLDNDYVRNTDNKEHFQKELRKRRKRRVFFIVVVPIVIIGVLINVLVQQSEHLAEKEQKKIQVEQQLGKVQEKQEMLNLKIAQLEDDEYIAKLLRKEYFLSEEGEIIFVIPEKDKKNED